jgi:hypothetical protein
VAATVFLRERWLRRRHAAAELAAVQRGGHDVTRRTAQRGQQQRTAIIERADRDRVPARDDLDGRVAVADREMPIAEHQQSSPRVESVGKSGAGTASRSGW